MTIYSRLQMKWEILKENVSLVDVDFENRESFVEVGTWIELKS